MRLASPGEPRRLGTGDDRAIGAGDLPRQALLDIRAQPRVRDEFRDLGSLRGHVCFPLRDRRPILQLPAPRGRVPPQLTRDRPGIAAHGAGDLANALALLLENRDLLALSEREVAARWLLGDVEWRHAASVSEPSCADRGRHADNPRGFLREQSFRDLAPERRLDGFLELRMPRRAELRTNRPVRGLLTTNHRTPPDRGVATTS